MSRQVVICLNPHDICPRGSLRKEPELLLIYDNATFPGGPGGWLHVFQREKKRN